MDDTPEPGERPSVPAQPAVADLYAWGLLVLLGAGMAVLGFHQIPKEQLTPFVAVLSGIIGAGVGTFIGWKWGNAQAAKRAGAGK